MGNKDISIVAQSRRGYYYVARENGQKGLAWISDGALSALEMGIDEFRQMVDEHENTMDVTNWMAEKLSRLDDEGQLPDDVFDSQKRPLREPDMQSVRIAQQFYVDMREHG